MVVKFLANITALSLELLDVSVEESIVPTHSLVVVLQAHYLLLGIFQQQLLVTQVIVPSIDLFLRVFNSLRGPHQVIVQSLNLVSLLLPLLSFEVVAIL